MNQFFGVIQLKPLLSGWPIGLINMVTTPLTNVKFAFKLCPSQYSPLLCVLDKSKGLKKQKF